MIPKDRKPFAEVDFPIAVVSRHTAMRECFALKSDKSRAFGKPKIAIKVITHLGDEAMKVFCACPGVYTKVYSIVDIIQYKGI